MENRLRGLGIEIAFLAAFLLIIVFLWQHPFWSFFAAAALTIIAFQKWKSYEDRIFFFVCGIVGFAGEVVCIKYGAWTYSNPVLLGVPLWEPLMWGFLGMTAHRIQQTVFSLEHKDRIRKLTHGTVRDIVYDLSMMGIVIALVSSLWRNDQLLFIVLLLLGICNVLIFHHPRDLFFIFISPAMLLLFEPLAVSSGAWTYPSPVVFGVPLWLFSAYFCFCLLFGRLGMTASALYETYKRRPSP